MKWFLADLECPICELEQISLYPQTVSLMGLECATCGYMIDLTNDEVEVPESFARAEHKRLGLNWEKANDPRQ